jgi:hypothetical protein
MASRMQRVFFATSDLKAVAEAEAAVTKSKRFSLQLALQGKSKLAISDAAKADSAATAAFEATAELNARLEQQALRERELAEARAKQTARTEALLALNRSAAMAVTFQAMLGQLVRARSKSMVAKAEMWATGKRHRVGVHMAKLTLQAHEMQAMEAANEAEAAKEAADRAEKKAERAAEAAVRAFKRQSNASAEVAMAGADNPRKRLAAKSRWWESSHLAATAEVSAAGAAKAAAAARATATAKSAVSASTKPRTKSLFDVLAAATKARRSATKSAETVCARADAELRKACKLVTEDSAACLKAVMAELEDSIKSLGVAKERKLKAKNEVVLMQRDAESGWGDRTMLQDLEDRKVELAQLATIETDRYNDTTDP